MTNEEIITSIEEILIILNQAMNNPDNMGWDVGTAISNLETLKGNVNEQENLEEAWGKYFGYPFNEDGFISLYATVLTGYKPSQQELQFENEKLRDALKWFVYAYERAKRNNVEIEHIGQFLKESYFENAKKVKDGEFLEN